MGQGVNGLAASLAVAGGVLLYSGIRNVRPADTLREILRRPNQQRPISQPFGSVTSGLGAYEKAGAAAGAAAGDVAAVSSGGLIDAVRSKIGAPYVWTAVGPDSFDCSGLVVWGLRQSGVKGVPRFTTYTFGAWAKSHGWTRVGRDQLAAGDVVLKAGHMGVMISHDRMINAPHTGARVREADLWGPQSQWWGWRPPGGQEAAELRRIG